MICIHTHIHIRIHIHSSNNNNNTIVVSLIILYFCCYDYELRDEPSEPLMNKG